MLEITKTKISQHDCDLITFLRPANNGDNLIDKAILWIVKDSEFYSPQSFGLELIPMSIRLFQHVFYNVHGGGNHGHDRLMEAIMECYFDEEKYNDPRCNCTSLEGQLYADLRYWAYKLSWMPDFYYELDTSL